MNSLHSVAAIVLMMSMPCAAPALDQSRINDVAPLEHDDEIQGRGLLAGMVMHDTMTRTGEAFYRSFVATWQAADLDFPGTLSVVERPSARWGSLIRVEFDAHPVYQSFIQGHGDQAEEQGQAAARAIIDRFGARLVTGNLFGADPDLGRREF